MAQWKSADDVLSFAIGEEEAAIAFYSRLAKEANNPAMREAFQQFAGEEKAHREKLLAVKAGKALPLDSQQVLDLRIADYMDDIVPTPDMTYSDALALAMKKEKVAFRLYTYFAAVAKDQTLKTLFLTLAQEEARHKLRFEIEYDDLMAKAGN